MTMERAADRDAVWAAMVKSKGSRLDAAKRLGISLRTLNRYFETYKMWPDLENAGFIKHKGPPRGPRQGGDTVRYETIKEHIVKYDGDPDIGELSVQLYGTDTSENRQRVRVAFNDLKLKGVIAYDGKKWFIL